MGKSEDASGTERYHIRAILRALDVLEAFSVDKSALSLTEVSEAVGLNASTTYRLLATLQSRGYIEQDPATGRYRIGVACLRPSSVFVAQLNVRERVYPLLVQLRDETRESVHLCILDHCTMEVIYLEKLEGLEPIGPMRSRVGGRAPAHCTGVGKALLAHCDPDEVSAFFSRHGISRYTPRTVASLEMLMEELALARERGYAIDKAEHEEGVMCVAVPVWNHLNRVQAAISISGTVERMTRAIQGGDLVRRVVEAGHEASKRLGHIARPTL